MIDKRVPVFLDSLNVITSVDFIFIGGILPVPGKQRFQRLRRFTERRQARIVKPVHIPGSAYAIVLNEHI